MTAKVASSGAIRVNAALAARRWAGMIILVEQGDGTAERVAEQFIVEGGKWYDFDQGWRARTDKPHTVGMQDHIHLYIRGNEVAVVNRDGTPSHNSDLSKLPNHIMRRLKAMNLMEGANLIVTASMQERAVPKQVLDALYARMSRIRTFREFAKNGSA